MAVLAIICIVLVMLVGVIYIVNRKAKVTIPPDYSVVQSELVGLPCATNAGLLNTKRKLLHWLEANPTRRVSSGLCVILDYDHITTPCIMSWVHNTEGDLLFPVEGGLSGVYNADKYKALSPRRRNLAKYMLACIDAELEKRK